MSRYIDRLPEPAVTTPVKIIVATASRTGTFSVYEALKRLGFKTYHMAECCTEGGVPHMQVLDEAIRATHNRYAGIKRYTKADFDKWFAEYDCIVEIPYFLGLDILQAYADDPNIKFILTDRDPDKWVTSINNTVGGIVQSANSFPMTILQHFSGYLYWFLNLNCTLYGAIADGTDPGGKNNREVMRRNYISYINMAKRILPADRLCYFRLEDGLSWEQICPFLGIPIPDEPFPDANVQENFKNVVSPRVGEPIAVYSVGRVDAVYFDDEPSGFRAAARTIPEPFAARRRDQGFPVRLSENQTREDIRKNITAANGSGIVRATARKPKGTATRAPLIFGVDSIDAANQLCRSGAICNAEIFEAEPYNEAICPRQCYSCHKFGHMQRHSSVRPLLGRQTPVRAGVPGASRNGSGEVPQLLWSRLCPVVNMQWTQARSAYPNRPRGFTNSQENDDPFSGREKKRRRRPLPRSFHAEAQLPRTQPTPCPRGKSYHAD
ncbi:hypothetical protein E4U28_003901 [Claviceps purpurea]|nr:hypothetical protein E4U28_003901 [Claviceps purpurea]